MVLRTYTHEKAIYLLLLLVLISPAMAQNRQTLRRKDSFFGLHFDFHAVLTDKRIGESLTEGMLDTMLRAVKPDYVQVDSKGHPGISSYPTRVGTPASDFTKDPLRLWRQVTARYSVALYVHHSGVYDRQAVRMHPEWATVGANGQRDSIYMSVHSAYADQLLIPQLKELSSDYGIDGAWIDGEAWAMVPDYSEAALNKFRQETTIATVPRSPSDSGYAAFLEFNRRSFRRYVKHYADAIYAFNPQFQVASNWAFSSLMPDPVDAPVDFLSGDLSPTNSVNSAAFEARSLASQGRQFNKPWDLMSWGFTLNWDRTHVQSTKSVAQLSQEAAEIMAMGSGFECYFSQNRDASIKPWQVETMAGIARFTRARQPFCQGALPLPQIGLLYSSAGYRHVTSSVYRLWNQELLPIKGVLTALLDGQHPTEVLIERHLKGRMQNYPLLVVPEWAHLEPAFREELLAYVTC